MPQDCAHFYEWNARCQLTSWNPTPENATKVPDGPIDYAAKHWAGLVSDYYAERLRRILSQALDDAASGQALDAAAVERLNAEHAYDFQVATTAYPTAPVGAALDVSKSVRDKYASHFASCA